MIPEHLAALQGKPVIYRRTVTTETPYVDEQDGHPIVADTEITVRGICTGWQVTAVDAWTPANEQLTIAGYGQVDAYYVQQYQPPWYRRLAWWRNT